MRLSMISHPRSSVTALAAASSASEATILSSQTTIFTSASTTRITATANSAHLARTRASARLTHPGIATCRGPSVTLTGTIAQKPSAELCLRTSSTVLSLTVQPATPTTVSASTVAKTAITVPGPGSRATSSWLILQPPCADARISSEHERKSFSFFF